MRCALGILLLAAAADAPWAADFWVGEHGPYATIQSAFDAALGVDGYHRILLERGIYHQSVEMESQYRFAPNYRCFNGSIHLQGGFGADFSDAGRVADPAATVVDGSDSWNSTISMTVNDCFEVPQPHHGIASALFAVTNLTARSRGNAIAVDVSRGGAALVADSIIDNSGSAMLEYPVVRLSSWGVEGRPNGVLLFYRNRIERNQTGSAPIVSLTATSDRVPAGPANLYFFDNVVRHNAIALSAASLGALADNTCAALRVSATARAVYFSHNFLQRNDCLATTALPGVLTADTYVTLGGGEAWVERNFWVDTRAEAALLVRHANAVPAKLKVRNNLIAQPLASGLVAVGAPASSPAAATLDLDVFNNTFHRGATGVDIRSPHALATTLVNNIFWQQVVAVSGAVLGPDNADGVQDPGFMDAANGNYCLRPGSPFVDAGRPVDYGALDAYGYSRVAGTGANLGAMECDL